MPTIKIPLKSLQRQASARPPEYYGDCISRGIVLGNDLILDLEEYRKLVEKYRDQTCKPCSAKRLP